MDHDFDELIKTIYDNTKEIEFLKEAYKRNENEIKEVCKKDEEAHEKLKKELGKNIMKDVKLWFFGLGFFLLVNILLTVVVIYFK